LLTIRSASAGFGDIGDDRDRTAPVRFDRGGHLHGIGLDPIDDGDLGAFLREPPGGGAPDAGARARNQRDFIIQLSHWTPPDMCGGTQLVRENKAAARLATSRLRKYWRGDTVARSASILTGVGLLC
jgi:hypothetical protein